MDQDLKKLRKLVKFMQKEGVLSVKLPNLELQLAPAAVFHGVTDTAPTQTTPDPTPSPEQQYTEEEILLWSAPGIPEQEH